MTPSLIFLADAATHIIPGEDKLIQYDNDDVTLGLAAMLIGLFMTFFGKRMLKVLIVSVGFFGAGAYAASLTPFILNNLVVYFGFPPEHYETVLWGVAFVAACIGGALALYVWKIGCYLAGGLAGFVLASWLLMVFPAGTVEAYLPRNAFIILFCASGTLFTMLIEEYILMAASVIAGSTICMFGLDKFARVGFAEAVTELVNSKYDSLESMSGNARTMLVCTAGIAMTGLFVQCCCQDRSFCSSSPSPSPSKSHKGSKSSCAL